MKIGWLVCLFAFLSIAAFGQNSPTQDGVDTGTPAQARPIAAKHIHTIWQSGATCPSGLRRDGDVVDVESAVAAAELDDVAIA